ncbi:MAG TPA: hypothetical protein VMY35_12260 [Phycisphaerae bacterium]|nr:hypothetical protein [Phycisphaerae bacterium]
MKRIAIWLLLALPVAAAFGAVAWEKDETGRVSLNTAAVLTSPDVSGIQFVKDEDGRQTFKTQADADAHAAAVAARNGISHFFLNDGDTFAVVVRVNGADFQTVASGTVETAAGTQGVLFVRARLGRDGVAPAKPVAAPVERIEP